MSVTTIKKHYLIASDFDQTLSFNDSGIVLSEMLGLPGFEEKVAGLAQQNFVQQGGELSYLLRHDPEYRKVRKEQLIEVGKRIQLKQNVTALLHLLNTLSEEHEFSFYVISASPQEVVQSALDGIVPADHIHGTKFAYDTNGEIQAIIHCPAGYGKVTVIDRIQTDLQISKHRLIYVGDGSSDIHVMLHVNHLDGLTIAVSENKHIANIAKRTVLSDDALGVAIPILEEIIGLTPTQILELFESNGFCVQEWDKLRTDSLIIRTDPQSGPNLDRLPVAMTREVEKTDQQA